MFVKGKSGNVKGRPKGIIDNRMRLNKVLMGNADALLKVATDKALAGDPQMLTTLLSRLMPTLKPEGAPVRFKHDPTLSPSKQIESVIAAIAAGQLTVEEGLHVVKAIESLANTRSMEGGGDGALVVAFKQMAILHGQREGMPIPASEIESFQNLEDPQAPLPPPVEE
jgi:hypothetical protein